MKRNDTHTHIPRDIHTLTFAFLPTINQIQSVIDKSIIDQVIRLSIDNRFLDKHSEPKVLLSTVTVSGKTVETMIK